MFLCITSLAHTLVKNIDTSRCRSIFQHFSKVGTYCKIMVWTISQHCTDTLPYITCKQKTLPYTRLIHCIDTLPYTTCINKTLPYSKFILYWDLTLQQHTAKRPYPTAIHYNDTLPYTIFIKIIGTSPTSFGLTGALIVYIMILHVVLILQNCFSTF